MTAARLRAGSTPRWHCDHVTEAGRPPRRRDIAWALLVAGLLSVGAIGVLWFNTALQRQADEQTHQQQVISRLEVQSQSLDVSLSRLADPASLTMKARSLHMHPARSVRWAGRHHRR